MPQELFRDQEKSEFVVVTIPSMLAVAETERLVTQLREQVYATSLHDVRDCRRGGGIVHLVIFVVRPIIRDTPSVKTGEGPGHARSSPWI